MANQDAAFGLRPVRYLNGAAYDGKHNYYLVPAADLTALFVGDAVKSGGTTGAAGVVVSGVDVWGMPTAIQAAAGDTILGVVVGFLPDPTALGTRHRVASTNRVAMVVDAPDVIFEVQEDGEGATLALVDIGENADLIVASGSTVTGNSAMEVDSSTHTAATAQVRLLRFVPRADNEPASQWSKVEVVINEHAFKTTSGT
jgi:hypothetical protein